MQIGYVCTNFNNSAVTEQAVKTLRANKGHDVHAVIVDNASSAEEAEKLRQLEGPGVTTICLAENLGYFRGLNVGIRHLREIRPDVEWMVVGNNDLEFPEDFVGSLERLAEELRIHPVISPDIVTGDGEHQNPHVISHISKMREVFYDLYYSNYHIGMFVQMAAKKLRRISDRSDELEWQTARHIYQGHGSVYLLGPRFFELFEELWAPTFMMSEEYFLSKQLSDVGEKIYYDPRLTIRHLWHASLDQLPSKRRWEMARDAHREYRKYVKIIG
ncbi:glycosyltransferase family 2 protein [Phyllobacterium leguminum]|uniref:GT2 family glycosyltransferase n=1 Tax=Phyllobacterium leguminum TaxID=314237 RepID=A0A318SYU0_9HYPH|nr:glycosyltransferase [Phyllobacterium leguminum]PYE87288.1 GT2 family glycosyltransferase [Phyllobacterium leguminum]